MPSTGFTTARRIACGTGVYRATLKRFDMKKLENEYSLFVGFMCWFLSSFSDDCAVEGMIVSARGVFQHAPFHTSLQRQGHSNQQQTSVLLAKSMKQFIHEWDLRGHCKHMQNHMTVPFRDSKTRLSDSIPKRWICFHSVTSTLWATQMVKSTHTSKGAVIPSVKNGKGFRLSRCHQSRRDQILVTGPAIEQLSCDGGF